MARVRKRDLLHGDVRKLLIQMALPLMAFNLVSVLYGYVDTHYISSLGELQVGAVSIMNNINLCGSAFATGLSAAGMALMSSALGAGQRRRASHIATLLFAMAMAIAFLISGGCALFSRQLLTLLKTPEDIFEYAREYLLGLAPSFLFTYILTIFQALRQSNGDSRSAVALNIIATLLNVVLDPLLIFRLNLGMLGASLATSLSKMLVCPIALFGMLDSHQEVSVDFRRYGFDRSILKQIIHTALPASLGSFMMEFGFIIMNSFILSHGSIIMSAYSLGNKISSPFYVPVNALSAALVPFIGQAVGAGDNKRARQCYRQAMILSLEVSAVLLAIGIPLAPLLAHLLVGEASPEMLENGIIYGRFSIGTIVFMVWVNNILAMFNGSGHTRSSLFINLLRLWLLRLPLLIFFGSCTDLGPLGIWMAMILSNLFCGIISQIWYSVHFSRLYPISKA
ncbi:MAG: MATE family efflux transporter [Erysipelotrichaceae bacterium]|nr:MATE family efflux transporter [Erysipelotrichaceae bacterium]MBR5049083.1 MATE family efflux transporter [Erysipelotrichaceae bacterium]